MIKYRLIDRKGIRKVAKENIELFYMQLVGNSSVVQ